MWSMSERKAPQLRAQGEQVGVRELRDHFSEYVGRASAGAEVVITEHGRPIARLVPLAGRSRLDELIDAGIVTPAAEPGIRIDWNSLPAARGRSLANLLIEEREAAHEDLLRNIGIHEDPPGRTRG